VKSSKKDVKKSTIKNKFQLLDSDSESDDEEQEQDADDEKEEDEQEQEQDAVDKKRITYASICAAPAKVTTTVKAITSSGMNPMLINGKRAWADYSSDEDE
jgi:hypothetical protein